RPCLKREPPDEPLINPWPALWPERARSSTPLPRDTSLLFRKVKRKHDRLIGNWFPRGAKPRVINRTKHLGKTLTREWTRNRTQKPTFVLRDSLRQLPESKRFVAVNVDNAAGASCLAKGDDRPREVVDMNG